MSKYINQSSNINIVPKVEDFKKEIFPISIDTYELFPNYVQTLLTNKRRNDVYLVKYKDGLKIFTKDENNDLKLLYTHKNSIPGRSSGLTKIFTALRSNFSTSVVTLLATSVAALLALSSVAAVTIAAAGLIIATTMIMIGIIGAQIAKKGKKPEGLMYLDLPTISLNQNINQVIEDTKVDIKEVSGIEKPQLRNYEVLAIKTTKCCKVEDLESVLPNDKESEGRNSKNPKPPSKYPFKKIYLL
jgi:hypothetical protein